MTEFSVLQIIKASLISISGTFVFSLVGFAMAKANVIDEQGGKAISKLIYFFMLPSFVLYNISMHFTVSNLTKFWIFPGWLLSSFPNSTLLGSYIEYKVFYFLNLSVGMIVGLTESQNSISAFYLDNTQKKSDYSDFEA